MNPYSRSKCLLLLKVLVALATLKTSYASTECVKQQTEIQKKLGEEAIRSKFVSEFIFTNETKPKLLMTWAGNQTLIMVTLHTQGILTLESSVYRSTNDGRSFVDITAKISGTTGNSSLLVSQSNGLQRNPTKPDRIYLACHDPASAGGVAGLLYYTFDGGATWHRSSPGFPVQSAEIQFHMDKPDLLLALSGSRLYLSNNSGQNWQQIKERVLKASWGVSAGDKDAIYATYRAEDASSSFLSLLRDTKIGGGSSSANRRVAGNSLAKSTDLGAKWLLIAEKIYSHTNKDGFLFISKSDDDSSDARHLEVSTDFGKTFNRALLPSATPDRYFVILGTSDGLAFVHMAAGNFRGYGTLYTSNSLGRVFSKSLERHFCPPFEANSDFYQVESMRGTFVTTVLHEDSSMHTVITHNRGAVWKHLDKPEGVPCPITDSCHLQVAYRYSLKRGVPADQPRSAPSAAGLLVVHGHVAASLQSSPADVFVSSDGGYSWYRALTGPHIVQIGNNGNFLVAVEKPINGTSPQVVKFSTDAGRCWHSHKFTNEKYTFTGLLTEPGHRALTVAIWGFVSDLHLWRVFVIDLSVLLDRACTDADYESWLSNGDVNYGNASHQACVLGANETIKRLRPESMCSSSYSYTPQAAYSPCLCTKDDFECEYGYTRPVNSMDCKPDPDVPTPRICDADTVTEIITEGYRKLPGNRCEGGFKPKVTQQKVLKSARCPQQTEDPRKRDSQLLIDGLKQQYQLAESAKAQRTVGLLVPLVITVAILLSIVLSLVVLARLRERRRRRLAFHYSAVSAAGRRADAYGEEDVEYQPADSILPRGGGGGAPQPGFYSATGATKRPQQQQQQQPIAGARKNKADDKLALVGEEDDEAPLY